jgi:hypothetical protein
MANNVYTVNGRLSQLENAVADLKRENSELRTHLWTALETKANDLRHFIQDSIRVPVDGRDGAPGRDGVDGAHGIQGVRGDCTVPNESEIASALLVLRKNHARTLADIKYRLELGGKQHRGMDAVLKSTLEAIEQDLRNGVQ